MNYQGLARKWRPQLFEEIVGQSHVVKTLKNAISLDRIGQAYLFAGPRGTGKTSTARILAKALNCAKGETSSPCNQCSNCLEIIRGESPDVLEIDGASNRGIDEIRQLREKIEFAPLKARHKIYIIDEIHMLTREAFNALLKTLEEPPSHVIFIFATTAPEKIPQTILSRCQRFDFRKILLSDILNRLNQIVKKEGIKVTREALHLIAEGAENSMRDAEKILDQLISYTDGTINEEDVTDILGMVEKKYLFEFTRNLAKRDGLANVNLANYLMRRGKSPEHLIRGWQRLFRDLIMLKMGMEVEQLESLFFSSSELLKEQTSWFGPAELIYYLEALSRAEQVIRFSSQPEIHLELLMIQLNSSDPLSNRLKEKEPELLGIYEKIKKLERKLRVSASAISFPEKTITPRENMAELSEKKGTLTEGDFSQRWAGFIRRVSERKKTVGTILAQAKILEINDSGSIILGLEQEFQRNILKKPENQSLLQQVVKEFFEPGFSFVYHLPRREKDIKKPEKDRNQHIRLRKIVTQTIDLFDGEIVKG